MGIPIYFKKLVQDNKNILLPSETAPQPDHFYLDANSIVYDSVRDCTGKIGFATDTLVIDATIQKIRTLIKAIEPRRSTLVAFDGIAPYGKVLQQRERRWKGELEKANSSEVDNAWNTTKITPGTDFMRLLSQRCKDELSDCALVSGSHDAGEGEHKIFEEIRRSERSNVAIYGLDADLIMLSLLHSRYCKSIHLFRETPEYIKSIDQSLDPEKSYYLDMNKLALSIFKRESMTGVALNAKIDDYVLACFLLGNDFLPHFPGLSLRANGMERLLEALNKCWDTDRTLVSDEFINWYHLRFLIKELSATEEQNIIKKCKKKMSPHNDESCLSALPILDRRLEESIAPDLPNWQRRYYVALNRSKATKECIAHMCHDYCKQLEWCFHYYKGKPVDWYFAYRLPYPPLLQDLHQHVEKPSASTRKMTTHDELAQLLFVLPTSSMHLLPKGLIGQLTECHKAKLIRVVWAFCRYFWESHLEFAEQSFEECIRVVDNYKTNRT